MTVERDILVALGLSTLPRDPLAELGLMKYVYRPAHVSADAFQDNPVERASYMGSCLSDKAAARARERREVMLAKGYGFTPTVVMQAKQWGKTAGRK